MTEKPAIHYENTVHATFLKRLNVFTALVRIARKKETVYLKSTRRLKDILVPGVRVCLERTEDDTGRRTRYSIISARLYGETWVNLDETVPGRFMSEMLTDSGCDELWADYFYGSAAFGFSGIKDGKAFRMEVRGCTLLDEEHGVGIYPDEVRKQDLRRITALTKKSLEGCRCTMAFVMLRRGADVVLPWGPGSPAVRKALLEASAAGVRIVCFRCSVEPDRIRITGRKDVTDRYLAEISKVSC